MDRKLGQSTTKVQRESDQGADYRTLAVLSKLLPLLRTSATQPDHSPPITPQVLLNHR
jgi:hypothetical protein